MRRALAAALLCAATAPARAEPSDRALVYGGLAMALPDYALGVTVHEGSHAVAGWMVGAELTELHLWPGRNPYNGAFQFGWTRVRGLDGDGARRFFLVAPKITDSVFLGAWATLYATDTMPDNRWGHLTIQVLATGFWVDFAKDVLVFSPHNDVNRIYSSLGLDTEWKKLPARLLHAAVSAGMAYYLYLGWRDLFTENDEATSAVREPSGERVILVAPVLSGRF